MSFCLDAPFGKLRVKTKKSRLHFVLLICTKGSSLPQQARLFTFLQILREQKQVSYLGFKNNLLVFKSFSQSNKVIA
jgi:hypothetical protein